jgi:thioredoxin-related protein
MKVWTIAALGAVIALALGCAPNEDDLWLDGGLEEATAAAAEQSKLIFVEFHTEWCSWCRRLETETLTDREVRSELDRMVAIRLDAEGEGIADAERFGIESYPTMLFLDSTGAELERIVGYLPPDKLVKEIQRISAGDTFEACLEELQRDPTDVAAIRRAVEGLLERSDPEGAIAKIKAFHGSDSHAHAICRELMFRAGRDLHYRVYLRAAKLYRDGWKATLDVPSLPGIQRLERLLATGLPELDPGEQSELMRTARFEDTAELLGMVDTEAAEGDQLYEIAAFAFRGGHYELAGELYTRWFETEKSSHDPESLNRAAWQLYLAQVSLDAAVRMARQAYEADPNPDIADTLARLLYVSGATDEAITLQREAARNARGDRAMQYLEVAGRMELSLDLGDEPAFETYPGPREISL